MLGSILRKELAELYHSRDGPCNRPAEPGVDLANAMHMSSSAIQNAKSED